MIADARPKFYAKFRHPFLHNDRMTIDDTVSNAGPALPAIQLALPKPNKNGPDISTRAVKHLCVYLLQNGISSSISLKFDAAAGRAAGRALPPPAL